MNEKRKEDFRKRLMEDRSQIAGEMISHGGVLERGAQHEFRDLEARAQGISSQWVDDRIAGDDGNLLEKIDLALERLEDGTYQVCANCGGRIPIARLEAKPSASLCVPCQSAKEPR
jgi:DnaK suppressor protein